MKRYMKQGGFTNKMSEGRYKAVTPSSPKPLQGCNAYKTCIRCGVSKPEDAYYRDYRTGGRRNTCKACRDESKRNSRPLGVHRRHEAGYESLLMEMFNLLVKDYHNPPTGEHAKIDGPGWERFRITKESIMEGVMGKDFAYYADAIQSMDTEELRVRLLRRLNERAAERLQEQADYLMEER